MDVERNMNNLKKSVEENWEEFWKDIILNKDGSVNLDQLKKELFDFSDMIHRMMDLTCAITNERMSYATYSVKNILSVAQEVRDDEIAQQIEDDIEDGACSFCNREF